MGDILFGTRLLPADRPQPREAGIAGMRFPDAHVAQLAVPFVFKSIYVEAN